jgi:TatD DNase family protein
MMLIEAHTHLDRYPVDDLETALAEITAHRIFSVSVSMDLPSYRRNREIAARCDLVLPTFGVHPWHAHEYADRLDDLVESTAQSPMLGEIGLDYYFVKEADRFPAQRTVFEFFLAAAQDQDKVVNLHTKGAEQDVLDYLKRYEIERAIVHWYSGPLDIFRKLADRGVYFTVGAEVLVSEHIQAIARMVAADRLLTETDNPGGPKSFIGGVGRPALILDVVGKLAELRGTTVEEIEATVQANFLRLAHDLPDVIGTITAG